MGGRLFHIVRAPKRLLAIECAEDLQPELETRHHECWGIQILSRGLGRIPGFWVRLQPDHPATPTNLLSLLQSCRAIYTETIPIFYAKNTFDINQLDTLLYLQMSVLPQRLAQIRVLNFIWDFRYPSCISPAPYDLATWCKVCDVLASIAGLQELMLRLGGFVFEPYDNSHLHVLESLTVIKQAKVFDVLLPWPKSRLLAAARDTMYPFRLKSRGQGPFRPRCTDKI